MVSSVTSKNEARSLERISIWEREPAALRFPQWQDIQADPAESPSGKGPSSETSEFLTGIEVVKRKNWAGKVAQIAVARGGRLGRLACGCDSSRVDDGPGVAWTAAGSESSKPIPGAAELKIRRAEFVIFQRTQDFSLGSSCFEELALFEALGTIRVWWSERRSPQRSGETSGT